MPSLCTSSTKFICMSGSVYSSESGSEDPLLVQLSATRARASARAYNIHSLNEDPSTFRGLCALVHLTKLLSSWSTSCSLLHLSRLLRARRRLLLHLSQQASPPVAFPLLPLLAQAQDGKAKCEGGSQTQTTPLRLEAGPLSCALMARETSSTTM
jgi:hypothetical protein